MSARKDQIVAIKQFKNAYLNLLRSWEKEGFSLNETNAVVDYPFHKSLDELQVTKWADRTIHELSNMMDRYPAPISHSDIRKMMCILREKRDDIGCMSVHDIDDLYERLKHLEYNTAIMEFHQMLEKALPDGPNATPEQQAALDDAWDKFYRTPFTISFGKHSVTIENDATVYNGIVDTLKDIIDDCL